MAFARQAFPTDLGLVLSGTSVAGRPRAGPWNCHAQKLPKFCELIRVGPSNTSSPSAHSRILMMEAPGGDEPSEQARHPRMPPQSSPEDQ
jgi:hypothetical protein